MDERTKQIYSVLNLYKMIIEYFTFDANFNYQ